MRRLRSLFGKKQSSLDIVTREIDRTRTEPPLARVAKLRALASEHPHVAKAWVFLAHAACDAQQYSIGVEAIERVMWLNMQAWDGLGGSEPRYMTQQTELLNIVARLDRTHQILALTALRQHFPHSAIFHHNYAIALQHHAPDEAYIAARRAIELSPDIASRLPHNLLSPQGPPGSTNTSPHDLANLRSQHASHHSHPPPPSRHPSGLTTADPWTTQTIGRYRILSVRTKSPKHVLYDALDEGANNTPVTLLRNLTMTNDAARRLFETQLQTRTPRHMAVSHDLASASDGTPFLVLERIRGTTAWEAFPDAAEHLDAAIDMVWLASRAVAEMHLRDNFLHGQIDPHNTIILDDNINRPILFLDSGLNTRLRALATQPIIHAPELQPSKSSDVYGLGLLLLYALTHDQDLERYKQRRLTTDTEKKVSEIIIQCLDHEPGKRPRAESVASSLDTLFFSTPLVPSPGLVLGDWRLDKRLSDDGGQAEVYKAVHINDSSHVRAFKFLRNSKSRSARYRLDIEATKTPSHPGIVTIYPGARYNYYFAMEYLDGVPLTKLIQTSPIPPSIVITYAMEIAEAVTYAHASGVIHRDLKPDNIFVLSKP